MFVGTSEMSVQLHCQHFDCVLVFTHPQRAGFGWESWKDEQGWWNKLRCMSEEIGSVGFTHIWLPPASQSVSDEGYLPSQLYNFSSKYGTHEELRECLHALKWWGMQPLADCVFNHRCADKQNDQGDWVLYSYALSRCTFPLK